MEMSHFEIDIIDDENMTDLLLYGWIVFIPQLNQYLISDEEGWIQLYLTSAKDEIDALLEYSFYVIENENDGYDFNKNLLTEDCITLCSPEDFKPEKFNIILL